MPNEQTSLHMVRLRLRADRLMELGIRRKIPSRGSDGGYLVHCQLRELFGEMAPSLFAVTETMGRFLTVLAYGDHDAETLKDRADAFADPAIHATLDWKGFASKPMPEYWSSGRQVGFELRACPVVRMASAGPRNGKGVEVDAFLAKCFRDPDATIDRQQVYHDWLRDQLDRHGGVRLHHVDVEGYKRERLLRPTHKESPHMRLVERPDVTFSGTLEVGDGKRFTSLLRRGVGRHRAFGFGMLLLRPSRGV